MSRDDSELIKRVYNAQKFSPSKSDWIHQIQDDKAFFGLDLGDDQIKLFSKQHFKQLLSQKVKSKRKEFLTSLQAVKYKSKYLQFSDEPEPYLNDDRFSKEQVQLLFSLCSQTFPCKENEKWKHDDNPYCDLCYLFPCRVTHILNCPSIL